MNVFCHLSGIHHVHITPKDEKTPQRSSNVCWIWVVIIVLALMHIHSRALHMIRYTKTCQVNSEMSSITKRSCRFDSYQEKALMHIAWNSSDRKTEGRSLQRNVLPQKLTQRQCLSLKWFSHSLFKVLSILSILQHLEEWVQQFPYTMSKNGVVTET